MFISVSQSLPTTSYVKMIDVWLIFNLLLPFIFVLLHTYMDTLRTESKEGGEGKGRVINHHGKQITVGSNISKISEPEERNAALVHRNEELESQVNQNDNIVNHHTKNRQEKNCISPSV